MPEEQEKIGKFNWYPGHIAKAERQLLEKIKVIDIIVELIDARAPEASKHKDLEKWAQGKTIITAYNKSDLAGSGKGLRINSKNRSSFKDLLKELEKAAAPLQEKFLKQGIKGRPIRVMVVGYPNVGKSSLINALAKNKKAKVADKAGVTRQQQWIDMKTAKLNLKLLDTPGIIPPKFYSEDQALKLAMINCLGDNAYDHQLVAIEGIKLIEGIASGSVLKHYNLNELKDSILEDIAKSKKLMRDGAPDTGRAADLFLKDFREGKLGNLVL